MSQKTFSLRIRNYKILKERIPLLEEIIKESLAIAKQQQQNIERITRIFRDNSIDPFKTFGVGILKIPRIFYAITLWQLIEFFGRREDNYEGDYFKARSSWTAMRQSRLKSWFKCERQCLRALPHTSAGKQGLAIPWKMRAIDRAVNV